MKYSILFISLILANCVTPIETVAVAPGAEEVIVSKEPPPPSLKFIKILKTQHGDDCRGYGRRGQMESAINAMKNLGASINAEYIQILKVKRPGSKGLCLDQSYLLYGKAFGK